MEESQIADIWMMFKEYLEKKNVEIAAERFVDLMADYGIDDETFTNLLGTDRDLDTAISYYLDIDTESYEDDEPWDE